MSSVNDNRGTKLSLVDEASLILANAFNEYHYALTDYLPGLKHVDPTTLRTAADALGYVGIFVDAIFAEAGKHDAAALVAAGAVGATKALKKHPGKQVAVNVGTVIFGEDIVNLVDGGLDQLYSAVPKVIDYGNGVVESTLGNLKVTTDTNQNIKTTLVTDIGVRINETFNDDGQILSYEINPTTEAYYKVYLDGSVEASDGVNPPISVSAQQLENPEIKDYIDRTFEALSHEEGIHIADVNDETITNDLLTNSLVEAVYSETIDAFNELEPSSGTGETTLTNTYQTNSDGSITVTDQDGNQEVYGPRTREELEALGQLGISEDGENIIAVTDDQGAVTDVFINNNSDIEVNGETYNTKSFLDTLSYAAEQLANFIGEQVESAAEWFTADDGLQLDFANWFGAKICNFELKCANA